MHAPRPQQRLAEHGPGPHGAPLCSAPTRAACTNIGIIQACIVTLITGVYLIVPDVRAAFLLVSAMTISLYIVTYLLLYMEMSDSAVGAATLEQDVEPDQRGDEQQGADSEADSRRREH